MAFQVQGGIIMWVDILFWLLTSTILGVYFWLVWDIAHWLLKDMVGEKNLN